ncbi:MAG: hypothetical protein A2622_10535 [Bdellovibrionales bacterium RIFCSPHIGHO2_01_FULL_40_29]|nr:MAG: hypothetical protein A2622_10535 [Bdellovibrionales bacterium RIFCSPHIGHO2_01_FULL_40_29]OFZ34396.1 MAG: hypothetical protein A3D17_00800 [Bdellovibrionales bacterium RIFCSPHIGHO2_02_FULL_40_15]
MTYSITVIIPTLGELKKIKILLDSLQNQKVKSDFEVVIIDNSCDENKHSQLQKLVSGYRLFLRLVKTEKKGVNIARNKGLDLSLSNLCLFIDDDCWLHDSLLLEKHISWHQQDKAVFGIGGYYALPENAGYFDKSYHTNQMRWLLRGTYGLSGNETRYLIGGHFSVKKDLVTTHQLRFDEQIVYGGSELGLFLLAYHLGLKMRLENLTVIHNTSESLSSLTKKLYKQGRGKAKIRDDIDYGSIGISKEGASLDYWYRALDVYLSLVFWFGYHRERKKVKDFFLHVTRITLNTFQYYRHQWLTKADEILKNKRDRGDRL